MAWVRSSTFMGFAFYSAMTVVILVGGNKVLSGEISLGTLVEFLAFMMILHMPVRQIGMTVNSLLFLNILNKILLVNFITFKSWIGFNY